MTHISLLRISGAGLLLGLSQLAAAESDLQANPYRPSVGSPATLPVPGYLEVEFGVANANTSGSNTKTSPLLLKYAFNDRIGVTLGLDPLTQVKTDSGRTRGFGDGNLTLKLAQPIAEGFNIGEEFSTTLPIATHDLGSNRADQTINFIVSNDFSGFHSDINLNMTHYGDHQDEGVSQNAWGWSAGLSHPIVGKLSGGIELSGTGQRGTDSTIQVLESVGYSLSNKTVLDFYLAQQKINSDTNNYSFGFGITHLFAK
ncbi:hypothetical protein [Aquirhabdus parva]|uniref:Transporter n=1 Tax=Aquirhabdus parva TaxID=2283318 RepID=A0A345P7P2_9GAMM|nr:hypothetical protein [Aquirhabdus parva]AXI03301.1 hypothetical protein HYN46_10885 [Aquirhabdus parva]